MISTVETIEEIKSVFNFLCDVLYLDAEEHKEKHYDMTERYNELLKQFNIAKEFIMYIKNDEEIIAAMSGKNMHDNKITIGLLAVKKEERGRGLATLLIKEFENRCQSKGVTHIDLGARKRACNLYKKLEYKYKLMVQTYDDTSLDDIRNINDYNLKELDSYQKDNYAYIIYEVDDIKEDYINHFDKSLNSSYTQYIFEKEVN